MKRKIKKKGKKNILMLSWLSWLDKNHKILLPSFSS